MDELERIRRDKLNKLMEKARGGKMEVNIDVSDVNFEKEVLEKSNQVPVVVDFWSEHCMPCLMLGPVLEKLAGEFNGKFVLAKLNVNQSPRTSQIYGIMSIPAVKMFKNGKVIDEFIGALPETQVRQWLSKNLGS